MEPGKGEEQPCKRSLFFQRMMQKKNKRNNVEEKDETMENEEKEPEVKTEEGERTFGTKSYVLSGEDAEDIHRENVELLSKMSLEDVMELRKTVVDMISPENMDYLKQRRKRLQGEEKLKTFSEMTKSFKKMRINGESEKSLPSASSELLNAGVHMDVVEHDKMEWMRAVQPPKMVPKSAYSARFDLEGTLMPYVEDEGDMKEGLYHHGEEPYRPGYTIEELYQLSRSATTGQRVMALNTLAAILEKEWMTGSFLEPPLIKTLLDSGMFLILRFSLDDSLKPVRVAALRAIASLFWNKLDMHYLGYMDGLFFDYSKPVFSVPLGDTKEEDLKEMEDKDLLHVDFIRGVLRTNILARFSYLLDDPELEEIDASRILKCLTRISYHSLESASIVESSPAVRKLFSHFRTGRFENTTFPEKFLMFVKLLSSYSVDFSRRFITFDEILPYIEEKISDYTLKCNLVTQCIDLYCILHSHHLVPQDKTLIPVLARLLDAGMCVPQYVFDQNLQGQFFSIYNYYAAVTSLVYTLTNALESSEMVCKCWLFCLHWINFFEDVPKIAEKLIINVIFLASKLPKLEQYRKPFLLSLTKKFLTPVNLSEYSFILNAKNDMIPAFPSLCYPLDLYSKSDYLSIMRAVITFVTSEKFRPEFTGIYEKCDEYFSAIMGSKDIHTTARLWPARVEIILLKEILDLWIVHERNINSDKRVNLAYLLTTLLPTYLSTHIRHLFTDVIFNSKEYQPFSTESNKQFAHGVRVLPAIQEVYTRRLPICVDEMSPTFMGSCCVAEYCLPIDWYYLPIANAYASWQSAKYYPVEISQILHFIYILEYFPNIINKVSPATRYCRLACIFFLDDMFLNVTNLLQDILKMILRYKKWDFDKQIPGLSFYEFYGELVDQFCNCGYRDVVFGMFLLVPLQQKYSVEYRKLIWGEKQLVLRLLNVAVDKLLVPIENYLEPCEVDVQLLDTYLRSLATGKIKETWSPILYRVAVHHVGTYIKIHEQEIAGKNLKAKIKNMSNKSMRKLLLNYA